MRGPIEISLNRPNYERIERIQREARQQQVTLSELFSWVHREYGKSIAWLTEEQLDEVEEFVKDDELGKRIQNQKQPELFGGL